MGALAFNHTHHSQQARGAAISIPTSQSEQYRLASWPPRRIQVLQ